MTMAAGRTGTPHLDGHVAPQDPLSPRRAFAELRSSLRPLIAYDPRPLWEAETAQLPWALRLLRRRTRDFVQRHMAPLELVTDAAPHPAPGVLSPELSALVAAAGRAGLLTDLLPRPLGSAPLLQYRHPLALQLSIRVEELSRGCGGLMLLLSAHELGLAPILLAGRVGTIRRFVLPAFRALKRGEPHLFAYAITEPAAGSDVEDSRGAKLYRPGVVARRVDGGWRLHGRKCFISGGDLARNISVFAALDDEGIESWTCFLVHHDMPGFRVTRTELKMGMRAASAAELEFNDVLVPDDHVIGGLRQGWALNRATLNLSRLPVAAMAVGFAQRACDIAFDFACRYRLGGKALINYQEIQLTLAQMIAETAAIRALVWSSARCYTPRQAIAAICKFYCTDVAVGVAERAMDLLGNHGMLHVHGAEKVFRDARLAQIFEGTNQINRLAVIEDLQEEIFDRATSSPATGTSI